MEDSTKTTVHIKQSKQAPSFATDDREVLSASDFLSLRSKIDAVETECSFLNSKILPKIREQISPGRGLSLALILLAAQNRNVFPECEKTTLKHARFIAFNGRRCIVKREDIEREHRASMSDSSGLVLANGKRLPSHLPREIVDDILSKNS